MLTIDTDEFIMHENTHALRSMRLLPLCMELLHAHALTWKDLTEIIVINHEGSLTGLRVGFAVANTLAFLLGVPVNRLSPMENVHPQYGTSTYLDTFDKLRVDKPLK